MLQKRGRKVDTHRVELPAGVFKRNYSSRMFREQMRSKEDEARKRSQNVASQVPPECLEDPRFIKVLATSLLSEIATLELIQKETDAEIKVFKESVAKGLEKRKVLKELAHELTKKNRVLSTANEALEREAKHRSIELESTRNRLDDATLREIADREKYKKILEDYRETWQKYKSEYEERPLAKDRRKACVELKKLRGQLMMAEYEKENLTKMLKLRKKIDDIRVRASIVQISGMTLQRWRDQEHIDHLNAEASQLQDELQAYASELTQLEQEEKERKKRAETEASIMPPPRLDFSFMRSICNEQGNYRNKRYMGFNSTPDPDSVSINTLMLEEMCNSTENDETPEICRKINDTANEEKEQSLKIPNSVSMIQERESINPIAYQVDPTPVSESTVNQSNIQNELKKLRIEKQQKQGESKATDKSCVDEGNDYGTNLDESHRRTLRWCEESQSKFAPFTAQKSSSFNEQTPGVLVDAHRKSAAQKFAKATSIHGSETRSLLRAEQEKRFKNGASMEIDEPRRARIMKSAVKTGEPMEQMETQEQRKRQSLEKLGKNATVAVAEFHSREQKFPDPIPSSSVTTPASVQWNCETPQLKKSVPDDKVASQESKVSDENPELPIDAGCSRPKIRKVEAVNYPLGQRLNDSVVVDSRQPDISYSPKQYVPSYMSSNLSNAFELGWQETPQASFCGESKATPGFPSLTTWKNWSPPHSERSLASSISKIGGQTKDTPKDEQDEPSKKQTQPSQFNFGGFFSMKPTQNPRNLF